MLKIPSELFERNIEDITVGLSDIHLYAKNEIEDAQIGYSKDGNGKKLKNWIGDNFLVIGHDSCCGDPIIVDLSEEKLPVYSMFHDDYSSLQKITNSFKEYINILNEIEEVDLSDAEKSLALIEDIKNNNIEEDYFESLIKSAYEFLNDLD